MRYAVTGATGFIGTALTRRLLADGHEVVALVRDPEAAAALAGIGAELRQGDILDAGSVRRAVEGTDGVFHLAAWYEVGRRNPRAVQINVGGTENVLQAAWDAGVSKIVHTSSLAVFSDTAGKVVDESYRFEGRHLSEYDRTKWMAHYEVAVPMAKRGTPVVIVQPGAVYGLGDTSGIGRWIRAFVRRKLRYLPAGNALCWGHVDDTVDGHVRAMERGNPAEAYIIAGPPHTVVEAFDIASRVSGIPTPRLRVPAGPVKAMSRLLTPLARVIPPLAGPAELTRLAGSTYLGDSSKAERELGFTARSLEEGFGEFLPRLIAHSLGAGE
ncbi:MAG: NAD-dependent epimerase/dehydratase family protein [Acidimicrobiia bacterium]